MRCTIACLVLLLLMFVVIAEEDHDTEADVRYRSHREDMARSGHDRAHAVASDRYRMIDAHSRSHSALDPNVRPQRTAAHAEAVLKRQSGQFDWLRATLLILIFGVPAVLSVRLLFR